MIAKLAHALENAFAEAASCEFSSQSEDELKTKGISMMCLL